MSFTFVESTIGLDKTELIRRRGPWRGVDDVELATLAWVDWFNRRRLHSAYVRRYRRMSATGDCDPCEAPLSSLLWVAAESSPMTDEPGGHRRTAESIISLAA